MAGKAKNKDDIVAMEGFITRHKKHIAKLEQIIRLMDNDLLDPAQIDDVSGRPLWRQAKWARICVDQRVMWGCGDTDPGADRVFRREQSGPEHGRAVRR